MKLQKKNKTMDTAVIKTGGKQYLVSEKSKIKIEKVDVKEGKEITFKEVLLLVHWARSGQVKVEIGKPTIKGAKVIGKVLKQGKAKKVTSFKYKPKKRYKVKKGHRQLYTEIEITKI